MRKSSHTLCRGDWVLWMEREREWGGCSNVRRWAKSSKQWEFTLSISNAVVKQVKKWKTTWCRTFNNCRILEFCSYWPSFLCMDSLKGCVNVSLQLCGAIHNPPCESPEDTWLTELLAVTRLWFVMLNFWASWHTYWSNNCGQWRNSINGREKSDIKFVPKFVYIHCPTLESSFKYINMGFWGYDAV
jgi:hypothetical protein